MNNPLRIQLTEYDCGPTSMLNAVSYLFPRDDIPPEIVRSIMLYCLDCFDEPAFQMVGDHPCEYNRIVPVRCMERSERELYTLGPAENREAILLFNEQTVLTAERTVEYMI